MYYCRYSASNKSNSIVPDLFIVFIYQLVQEGHDAGYLPDDMTKSELLRLLLLKHKFVDATPGGMGTADGGASMGARLKRTFTKASMAVSTKLDYPSIYK